MDIKSKNISGFKLNIDNRGSPILIPYRYRVMDDNCKNTLKSGYFREYEIQNNTIYTEKFDSILAKTDKLCFELTPMTFNLPGYTNSFLSVKKLNGRLLFDWLYFSR